MKQAPQKADLKQQILANQKQLQSQLPNLLTSKQLAGEYTSAEWKKILSQLLEYKKAVDQYLHNKPDYTNNLIVGTIVYVVLLFILFFASGFFLTMPAYFTVLLLVLPIGVWFLFRDSFANELRSSSIPDRVYKIMVPILAALQEDMLPEQVIDLKADLGQIAKQKSYIELPHRETRSNENWYIFNCLEFNAVLIDESYLNLESYLLIRQRTRYKPKGNKIKLKVKLVHQIKMSFSKKNYQLAQAENIPATLKYKENNKRHTFQIKKSQALYATKNAYKGNFSRVYKDLERKLDENAREQTRNTLESIGFMYQQVRPL